MKFENEALQTIHNKAFYVWHEEFLKNSDGLIDTSPQPLAFICNVGISKLSSGDIFSGFVTDQGYLYFWVWNKEINDRNDVKISPIPITNIDEFVCDLSCGSNHFSCVTENNYMYIWVFPPNEPKENITIEYLNNPIVIKEWDSQILKIKSGSNHILVLLANNDLYHIETNKFCRFEQVDWNNQLEIISLNKLNDRILEIDTSDYLSICLSESNKIYYWNLNENMHLKRESIKTIVENITTDSILEYHACKERSCNYFIKSLSILKDSIVVGVIFNCEIQDNFVSNEFTNIYIINLQKQNFILVKRAEINMFKSFHLMNEYICAIFVDETILFKNIKEIDREDLEVLIRPKGDTKLFHVTSNRKCLVINIQQNTTLNNEQIYHADETLNEPDNSETFKKVESEKVEFKDETFINNEMEAIQSNTSFEATDKEDNCLKNDQNDVQLEKFTKINEPSYLKPTVSSIMTKKTKVNHSFLRKGEGKIKFNCNNSEKFESNLISNTSSNKCNISNSNFSNSTKNIYRRKHAEYEAKIFELEEENKRILKTLDYTNQQYLKDMKSLYNQLKEKNEEKFPLKLVVEQLQKELFIEKEEKCKFKEELDSVKSQLQIELENKNFKKDLLNTQLILERDKLAKEKQEKEAQYQELNKKYFTLEILLNELKSRYSELEEEKQKLTQKYNEMDQNHTETVNQLSKSELQIYELKKEIESLKYNDSSNICVNELYEYIEELEKKIENFRNNDESQFDIKKDSKELNKSNVILEKIDYRNSEDFALTKDHLNKTIEFFKNIDYENIQSYYQEKTTNSEISQLVSDLTRIFIEKISDLNSKNKIFEKKVNILEKSIKNRKNDVSILVENELKKI